MPELATVKTPSVPSN